MIWVALVFDEGRHGHARETVTFRACFIPFFLRAFPEVTLSAPIQHYGAFASLAASFLGGNSLLSGEEIRAGSTISPAVSITNKIIGFRHNLTLPQK
jgi:hypothetical protein